MAEHPEQVLPQQRLALRASKKWVPNWRSIHSRKKARLTAGHRQQVGDRGGQRAPHQDRHAVDRHAGRARAQEGDHEVGRADRGRDAQQDQAEA
jgi:hypothetical protein